MNSEFTGYYAADARPCPVMEVKAIHHRDHPILLGSPPMKPPRFHFGLPFRAASIWSNLDSGGVSDVVGVWQHVAQLMTVVSLKQRYAGHAKRAALVAALDERMGHARTMLKSSHLVWADRPQPQRRPHSWRVFGGLMRSGELERRYVCGPEGRVVVAAPMLPAAIAHARRGEMLEINGDLRARQGSRREQVLVPEVGQRQEPRPRPPTPGQPAQGQRSSRPRVAPPRRTR